MRPAGLRRACQKAGATKLGRREAILPGGKDEPLPKSTMQLVGEFKETQDEERRARNEFLAHLNTTYFLAEGNEVDVASAYRLARGVNDLYERGGAAEKADEETARLAQAYLDTIQKRKAATSIMTAELAASHPELLAELNWEL